MGRLDPRLRLLIEEAGGGTASEPEVSVFVRFSDTLEPAIDCGFRPTTVGGGVAGGFAPLDRLEEIAALESVVSVEMSRPLVEELDISVVECHVKELHGLVPPRRGAGVIVGVIDREIDFRHGSFRTPTGETRILALWDQKLAPQGAESPPAGRTFGVEYLREDIDEALRLADPLARVRHERRSSHGTHVTGIAAGNGLPAGPAVDPAGLNDLPERPGGTYVGVAPEADIIFVALDPNGGGGDSRAAMDAIGYLLEKAEQLGKPIVINLSQGDYVGPHDGTSPLEQYIDSVLGRPGRILVKSAGNGRGARLHAAGTVAQGQTFVLPFRIPAGDTLVDRFDIWYARGDLFDVAVRPPGGAPTEAVAPDSGTHTLTLPNQNTVRIDSETNDPGNGDNNILIRLRPGAASAIEEGPWEILLTGRTVTDGRFHAWIDLTINPTPGFTDHVSDECTISAPGTARQVINVAAYVTRFPINVGRLVPTSSAGPTRDGRPAPDLAAPGSAIVSARRNTEGGPPYLVLSGTSAAAPHVAGAAALLLERDPTLTPERVRELLRRHASPVCPAAGEESGWGAGKLDALAAFNALLLG